MSPSALSRRITLRRQLIAAREALEPIEHQRLTQLLSGHLDDLLHRLAPQTLGFCWPYRAEPDVRPLVMRWLEADSEHCAALPVVPESVDQEQVLRFKRWLPKASMQADRYGIPVPAEGEWLQPDVLLIPVNGFDARGFRLGYGGGHFDRTLAALKPAPITVGIGFELARLEQLTEESHDVALNWLVTEAGAFATQSSV